MDGRRRIERLEGRHSLVDGIPFQLPVDSRDTPALMAVFPISAARAAELIPGEEIHPFRLVGDVGLLVVTVVDYKTTDIGSYIEFSIAIACTHGLRPGPPLRLRAAPAPRDRPVRRRPARLDRGLGQGRQGHLGDAQAPGEPRLRRPRRRGLEPVRPGRAALLPDRGRPPARAGAARQPAGGQLLRLPRHAQQVVHLLPRPRRLQPPAHALGPAHAGRPPADGAAEAPPGPPAAAPRGVLPLARGASSTTTWRAGS